MALPQQQQSVGHYDYGNLNMNYQQPYIMDYARRFGTEVSPSTIHSGQNYMMMENRQRNMNNMSLLFDMDSGEVRNERRPDPTLTTILARLDTIIAELALTVKTTDIADIVRKDDLRALQSQIDGQASELQKWGLNIEEQAKKLKVLSELVDKNTASIINLGQETADMRTRLVDKQSTTNMAAANSTGPGHQNAGMSPKRLNIIVEGLPMDSDPCVFVLALAEEVGLILYKRDITTSVRLRRRDSRDSRPAPLLIGFHHAYPRDHILRNKRLLKASIRFSDIWINADETIEVRREK